MLRLELAEPRIRTLTELDIEAVTRIAERVTGRYSPQVWEGRVFYAIRRDPDAPKVAELEGEVIGFMLGEVRGGEFGLEEPTGWVEFFGVDPAVRRAGVGRLLTSAVIEHFRSRGARVARTVVAEEDADMEAFLRAVGFSAAPLAVLELRL